MTQASSEKWQRYEQALLVAMGCAELPPKLSMAMYRLLIIPTFHSPCCLKLLLTNQEGELSFSLLTTHTADIFDASWRENAQAELASIQLARQSCVEEITALNAEQVASFKQQLALLEPMTLGDISLASRDGVSIRCDCSEQNRYHTFAMRGPTAQDAPRHSNLIALLLDAAREQFPDQRIQDYLSSLHRYLR
jgi:hypothetical protein